MKQEKKKKRKQKNDKVQWNKKDCKLKKNTNELKGRKNKRRQIK